MLAEMLMGVSVEKHLFLTIVFLSMREIQGLLLYLVSKKYIHLAEFP